MKKGTPVTVQRDEVKYPAKGTWPKFRGKEGVTCVVAGVEYGVSFSGGHEPDAYFKRYELIERK